MVERCWIWSHDSLRYLAHETGLGLGEIASALRDIQSDAIQGERDYSFNVRPHTQYPTRYPVWVVNGVVNPPPGREGPLQRVKKPSRNHRELALTINSSPRLFCGRKASGGMIRDLSNDERLRLWDVIDSGVDRAPDSVLQLLRKD